MSCQTKIRPEFPALFLDRDGTIIAEKHYLCDPNQVELIPGTISALKKYSELGGKIFIVTNQSGIGRGYFTSSQYEKVRDRVHRLLGSGGVSIQDEAFCPHAPQEKCRCRKPATGMWEYLAKKHALSPGQCIVVGDKRADINFGINAGFAASILVLSGHGAKEAKIMGIADMHPEPGLVTAPAPGRPNALARNLAEAVELAISLQFLAQT